jgi:outer membrane protein OmpA-like peptidoglycan-associated protein
MLALVAVVAFGFALPGNAQAPATEQAPAAEKAPSAPAEKGATHIAAGQKMEIEGVVLKRTADNFLMRDNAGNEYTVILTNDTEVKERKSNPFRRAKNYATTQLLRGLNVKVEGRGDSNGNLVAEDIKLRTEDLRVAQSVESRVTPVEGRLGEAEGRLSQSEQNAQRLSGQVEELSSVANAARGGAKAAQETADSAVESARTANAGVASANQRISSLDDYDVKESTTVNFKVGSAVLSKAAKEDLDKVAEDAKQDKGFIIEVAGFASAEGNEAYNRRLSQRRADAVISYLAENHNIPLRRFITPMGLGESQPVADNDTRAGRQQNRRVEVKILLNKGLVQSAATPASQP